MWLVLHTRFYKNWVMTAGLASWKKSDYADNLGNKRI